MIPNPKISIIINFYNMCREAKRTLFSATTNYQIGSSTEDYEVIAIDNGSTEPLDENWILSLGNNFRYIYFDTKLPSPSAAINCAVNESRASLVMCCIDGARILSPGVLKYTIAASKLYDNPFIYTLSMHIGPKPQNYLVTEGYNQNVEDKLIKTVNWQANGYKLFEISSVALSSKRGFFSELSESNCFALKKSDFVELWGFDERFATPGGGLVNLDFFNRVHEDKKYSPIMLLGEATFHQFHGGVATNVPLEEHPWSKMEEEYKKIKGKPFKTSYRRPEYFGSLPVECYSLLLNPS